MMTKEIIGELIDNKYLIQKRIGEGGMGIVYQAREKETNKDVAIKILKPKVTSVYKEDLIRFKREIELISKLDHPNTIKVYNSGNYQEMPFIVMELLDGLSLSEYIKEGHIININDAVIIIRNIAQALDYFHNQGIVHRDIKPGNIYLTQKREIENIKILDFGLALIRELKELKEEEAVIGTFGYMSPEATGIIKKPVDERSDLYSLGVVFYRLLTNEMPFKAKALNALLHQQVTVEPEGIRKYRIEAPIVLEEIIKKLMSKEKDSRYQSARGLIYDLDRYLKGEKDFVIGTNDQKIKLTYETRLVGREEELAKIRKLIDKALDKEGSVCLIGGEPGVGKTRLVEGVKDYAYLREYEQGGLFLSGRCVSQENRNPYQPFKEAIDEYIVKVNKLEKDKRNGEIKRIKEAVGELGEILIKLNPNMREILGDVPELVKLDPERENQRFVMVVAKFITHLTIERQLCILFIDDLQWADEGSLRILEEINTIINESNLFIVGTYRSNEVDDQHSLMRIKKEKGYGLTDIILTSFDHSRLNRLVAGVLGEKEEYVDKLTDYVLRKSSGNPFFAITILRELVEQKAIEWKEGRWLEDWDKVNKIQIFGNILDMVLFRIKNIPDNIDKLLRTASIIGKEFEIEMLFDLMDEKAEEIIAMVDESENRQLLEKSFAEKGKIVFVHDRIREAFYSKMTAEERVKQHLRIGHIIEERNKGREEAVIFELAYHYIEAKEREKALLYVIPAAKKTKENYANDEALKYYEVAIRFLGDKGEKESDRWIETNEGLAEVYLTVGKNDAAVKKLDILLPLKKSNLEKARTYKKIGIGYFKKGEFIKCEDNLAKGLELLGENIPKRKIAIAILKELIIHLLHSLNKGRYIKKIRKNVAEEKRVIAEILLTLGWMYVLSDIGKFVCSTLRLLNICEAKIGKSKELGFALFGYGGICIAIPLFKRAISSFNRGLDIRKELADEWGIAQIYQGLGICYSWMGKHQKSLETLHQSREKFEKLGDIWELGMVYKVLGKGYRRISDYQKGIYNYNQYLKMSYKINDKQGISAANINISYSYIETGAFEDAEKSIKESLQVSREMDDKLNYCEANAVFGYLEFERKNYDEAIKYLETAVQIDKKNRLLREFAVVIYYNITEAYIEKFKVQSKDLSKKEKTAQLKRIKTLYKEALAQTKSWPNHYFLSIRAGAKYYALVNNKNKANEHFLRSIKLAKQMDRKFEIAKGYYEYGLFLQAIKRVDEAQNYWQQAYNIFKAIGALVYTKRCADLLSIKPELETEKEELTSQERLSIKRRMATVLDTSRYLSSILDINELLDKIMSKTIEVVGAERGILFVYEGKPGNEKIEAKVLWNIKEGDIDLESIKGSIVKKVKDDRKPIIIEDVSREREMMESWDSRSMKIKSIMCAPIVTKNNLWGMIYLDNEMVTGLFGKDDLEVLEMIASQAGVSIENAILYQNLKEQERLKSEMAIAERIQTAIVPEPPKNEELEITAVMKPAEEVGGDYYDIMYDKEGHLWFAIGDVTGHGVTPGLIMMMAQSSFSTLLKSKADISPKTALLEVNKLLKENITDRLHEMYFMTMQFIEYSGKGRFTFSNAGHPDALIYRNRTKAFESISRPSMFLGTLPGISQIYTEIIFSLEKGDILLLYTDGITESRKKDDTNLWTEVRLKNIIAKNELLSLENIRDNIMKEALAWCDNQATDDMTMVLVRKK